MKKQKTDPRVSIAVDRQLHADLKSYAATERKILRLFIEDLIRLGAEQKQIPLTTR